MFGILKAVTNLDPTGLTGYAVDKADQVVGAAVGGATIVAKAGVSAVTSPIETATTLAGFGTDIANRLMLGPKIVVQGIELEIDSVAAAKLLYAVLVPKTAHAVLNGRMPNRDDFVMDVMAVVGGPIEGIFIAANSKSAELLARGETPTAEQLGADMISALTPVALRKLGL
jgi:hypothetical protein